VFAVPQGTAEPRLGITDPEHENPRRQNMWIVNPFVEHKETAISHEETLQLIELSSDKGLEGTFNSMSDSKFWTRMKN